MLKVFLFWPKRDKMGMILKGAFPPRKGFFTMKFSEMTYTRPDIDALLARCKELTAKAAAADSGEALVEVYYEQSRAFADYNTAANLANIHYTCDTRDDYWKAEQDFFDANGPAVSNASVEISRAFLANPHVDALTEAFGSTCVAGMKNAVLGMDERTSLAPTRRAPTPPSAGPLMRPKPVTSTPTAPSWTSCTPRSSRT